MHTLLVITPCVPKGLPTQGSIIAGRLRQDGIRAEVLSHARTRVGRLLDVVVRGVWWTARHDCVLVDVFGERAFVYESCAILYAVVHKRRVVAMLHNSMLPDFVERWPRWSKFVLAKANVVLTPHQFLRDRLAGAGIRVDGMIPNFIDTDNYVYRERSVISPRLLYLRGMHPLYNPEMALRAFGLIQLRYPDASLTMAGPEGPDSTHCRKLVNTLKLNNVSFRGVVPKREIPALADAHDIHLHTNRLDNMPVTILEMWACGVPIVGTAVGGMPDLVQDGSDALLVPSEDHQAMAEACVALLTTPELVTRLSRNGRARAESLTWRQIKPMWEDVLFRASNTSSTGVPHTATPRNAARPRNTDPRGAPRMSRSAD